MEFKSKIKTIEWVDTYSKMVDQTVIPYEYKFVNITSGDEMFDAIRNMIVKRRTGNWDCRSSRGNFIRSISCKRKSFKRRVCKEAYRKSGIYENITTNSCKSYVGL